MMGRRSNTLAREHNQLGITFYQSGAIDLALEQFKRATKRAPWVASYWLNLGVALLEKGSLDEAESSLKRATELNPRSQSACFHLAQLSEKRCDHLAVCKFYQQTIELCPDSHLAQRARERLEGWRPRFKIR